MAASSRSSSGAGLSGVERHGHAARAEDGQVGHDEVPVVGADDGRPGRPARGPGPTSPPRRRADLLAQLPVGRGLAPADERDGVVGVRVDDAWPGSRSVSPPHRRRSRLPDPAGSRLRPILPITTEMSPRRWILRACGAAAVVLVALASAPAAQGSPSAPAASAVVAAPSPGLEAQFVSRINSLRASKGLSQLQVSSQLLSVARGWTEHMVAAGQISHNPNLASQVSGSVDEARRERGRRLRRRRPHAGVHQQPGALHEPRGPGLELRRRRRHRRLRRPPVHDPQLHARRRWRRCAPSPAGAHARADRTPRHGGAHDDGPPPPPTTTTTAPPPPPAPHPTADRVAAVLDPLRSLERA